MGGGGYKLYFPKKIGGEFQSLDIFGLNKQCKLVMTLTVVFYLGPHCLSQEPCVRFQCYNASNQVICHVDKI